MCRILLGKYCSTESFLKVENRTNESHGWRGVLIGCDLIRANTGWTVGDGKSIEVWNEPWLDNSTQLRPTGPAPEHLTQLKVSELIDPNSQDWNRAKIQSIIPQYEELILKIKLSKMGVVDKLIWLKTNSGEYTTKSGYWTAYEMTRRDEEQHHQADFDWNKGVWKLNVAPKIKLFLWKTFQGALPVGERLISRNNVGDTKCTRCGLTESIHHLLFQCEFAQRVWALAPINPNVEGSGLIDFPVNWTNLMGLTCLPPIGLSAEVLIPWLLWSLWIARNNLLFNKKTAAPEDIISRAVGSAREWLNAQEPAELSPRSRPIVERPIDNCHRLQSDAAWREDTGIAGLGWTIKKNTERASFGSHCYFVASPMVAEALALREAIFKSKELGIQRLRCETDSLQLVKAITAKKPPPDIYGIVSDIISLISEFELIQFRWIPREQNKDADVLAKQALLLETNVMNPTLRGF